MRHYGSWGGVLEGEHHASTPYNSDAAAQLLATQSHAVIRGRGRSYGDLALNPGGGLIDTAGLDRFIEFDSGTGLLTCEAGVTLADILAVLAKPDADGSGWLPPVMPGTRFITIGGAIANDVHGKNAHLFGSFGCHVEEFELARSDGSRLICSDSENVELFRATIGGLGLTGLILNATLRLRRVEGLALESEEIRFGNLDEFFALDTQSAPDWEYTAAWIDCLAGGADLGRGLYMRGRHAPGEAASPPARQLGRSVPLTPLISMVNNLSVRAFNALYLRKPDAGRRVVPYEKNFFPLDAIGNWNRLYGPRGFYQFQSVVPHGDALTVTRAMLRAIADAGQGSMLVVMKRFGDIVSPGLMSFPMPGLTLALDFPNRGQRTLDLLRRLEDIAVEAGGRLYPAKDAVMTAATFAASYSATEAFRPFMDPALTSAFARRVGLLPQETAA